MRRLLVAWLLAIVLTVGFVAGASPTVAQQASIVSIGYTPGTPRESIAYDVTDDGRVAVGFEYELNAVRWTKAKGFEALGPGGVDPSGRALGVSGDGVFVVGEWQRKPFLWTRQGGLVELGGRSGRAEDVTSDGAVVVGTRDTGRRHAFRWTAKEGFQDLGTLNDVDGNSEAFAVSDDGRFVVGRSRSWQGFNRAFRWSKSEGLRDLGGINGGEAYQISPDGRFVVGLTHDEGFRAFLWTAATGMQVLSGPGGRFGLATDVSDDGNVLVGQSTHRRDYVACVWTDGEPRFLHDLLRNDYGVDLDGWFVLREILACSPDGTTLVGSGHRGLWRVGFIAKIPPPPRMSTTVEPANVHRVAIGQTFEFPFSAVDPGGEPLTFRTSGRPPGSIVTPAHGAAPDAFDGNLTWTPAAGDVGTTHDVHLFVRDVEGRRASLRFRLKAVASATAPQDEDPEGGESVAGAPRQNPSDRGFAAPALLAAANACETASELYVGAGFDPAVEEGYRAAEAAYALCQHVAGADATTRTELRARQAGLALLAAERLYESYLAGGEESALLASADAWQSLQFALLDLAD